MIVQILILGYIGYKLWDINEKLETIFYNDVIKENGNEIITKGDK